MEHDRILGYFLEEAKDHLNTIEQGLRKLPETVRQPATIRELFRAAHSIKGSAAMLGLLDVQQVGNQFEANFKLLKEEPTIAVDNKLQNLFLESFNFLRAAIDEVRTSSDPYRRDPHSPDPVGDPVFEELKSYLQYLLQQIEEPTIPPEEQSFSQDPTVEQVFGDYVTRKLGEITSLCLQPDSPEMRAQIQQICQKLGSLGDNFEFLEWTSLFTACRLAIANPHSTLHQLGESISIAVKQAQLLILADRHQEIGITPDLEALIDRSDFSATNHRSESLHTTEKLANPDDLATENISPAQLDQETVLPGLSSIYDRVPFQFDRSDDLADLGAVPEAEFDSGSRELEDFMNLLGEDIPADGTWMQDDEFNNSDEFALEDLTNNRGDQPATSRAGQFYEQIFEPSATTAATTPPNQEIVNVDYDEETFFTPDFGDIEDPDIATFWSDVELGDGEQSPYSLAELDLGASSRRQFQPEQPLDRDLDTPLPDFSLDDRPMSDLFPIANAEWTEAELPPQTSETIAAVPLQPAEVEAIEDNDFAVDLQSYGDGHSLDPLESIGTETIEQGLITQAQDLNPNDQDLDVNADPPAATIVPVPLDITTTSEGENIPAAIDDGELSATLLSPATEIGFGIDILATADASHDFTDLDVSDSIELEQLGDANSSVAEESNDWDNLMRDLATADASDNFTDLDVSDSIELEQLGDANSSVAEESNDWDNLMREMNIDDTDDGKEVFAVNLAEIELDSLPTTDSISAGYTTDIENPDLTSTPISSESVIPAIVTAENHLTNNVENSSADLDIPHATDVMAESVSDSLMFEDFDSSELPEVSLSDVGVDELTGWIDSYSDPNQVDDTAGLDLAGNDHTDPVPALSINNDPGDFNLDSFNLTESVPDYSDNNNFADLDLDSFNTPEAVAESSDRSDFADLDLDSFNPPEAVAESSDHSDFADLDLGLLNSAEPVIESPDHSDFANLDLDSFNTPEAVAESSDCSDFADLDLDLLNTSESDASNDFANLDFNTPSNQELPDLSNILEANPPSNSDLSDLDGLLLGTAAVAAGGSTFADLDALMGNPAPADEQAIDLNDLDRLLTTPTPVVDSPVVKPAAASGKADRRSKQRTFEQTMRVSVRHLDNLNNLVGELVVSRNTLEQDQNRMRQFIDKLLSEVQKLNEVGKRMQDLYERSLMENSLLASRQQARPQLTSSVNTNEVLDQTGALVEYDPLEMDRFTPIHLLSQKMIELTVRVRESTADIEFVVDGSTEVTRTLRQITGQLQEDLTKSRMIPFAQTADRLQRGVRDNGLKYGKQVELAIEGRDTLIDKVILESLSDPLIHMVNNAIAHGIESPADRLAAGKPPLGHISVRALHQGNQTIISISDDGAGINTERVKAKAIEKGIITTQQALTMTKPEVYELLFLPSFSTKDQADELAGRGVGMDVVRTSLTEIRGTITTESQLGVGTTFTIRLPLALSIAKALIAVNNKTNIAFPMDGIEDTQDVSPEQIQTNSEGEQCIFWRDNLMPFKPLSDLLAFNRPLPRNNFYGTQEDDSDLVSILILRSDGNLIAVQVDKIIGDQEIVIKPLQGPASKPLGIAGATVLGDGRIVAIADVMELIDLAKGTLVRHVSTQWTTQLSAPTPTQPESMVLIVDDSITVRELLSLTFKRAGYRVEQARDGQEAWDKLRAGLPCDIVFCDIEMPRMDGLEFLSRIQKDVALSKVPVAMLTSRGSDRHRQIASQLGASGYFIKPYLEEALLDAAKRMIKGEVLAIV